jgi:hypothetical protein
VTGEMLSEAEYAKHLRETLPTEEDEALLKNLISEKDWVQQMQLN